MNMNLYVIVPFLILRFLCASLHGTVFKTTRGPTCAIILTDILTQRYHVLDEEAANVNFKTFRFHRGSDRSIE